MRLHPPTPGACLTAWQQPRATARSPATAPPLQSRRAAARVRAQVLVLSVPGPGHPLNRLAGAAGDRGPAAPHGGAAAQQPASMHSAFPSPASQFVRDLVERLLLAGTATSDRRAQQNADTRQGRPAAVAAICTSGAAVDEHACMYLMQLLSTEVVVPRCGLRLRVSAVHEIGACRFRPAGEQHANSRSAESLCAAVLRDVSNMHIDSRLPYELLALETALAACSRGLEAEANDIEVASCWAVSTSVCAQPCSRDWAASGV